MKNSILISAINQLIGAGKSAETAKADLLQKGFGEEQLSASLQNYPRPSRLKQYRIIYFFLLATMILLLSTTVVSMIIDPNARPKIMSLLPLLLLIIFIYKHSRMAYLIAGIF